MELVIVWGVGVVVGIYVASQIAEHVDSKKRHKEFEKNLRDFDAKNKS